MGEHCCRWMRKDLEWVCQVHPDRHDCDDLHILHDGGRYFVMESGPRDVRIFVCPWCGSDLSDGSVMATITVDDGVEFDIAPHLATVEDETLARAARAEWPSAAVRELVGSAIEQGRLAIAQDVGAEFEALRELERAGETDHDRCMIDEIAADLWLRRHRPHLTELTR